MIRRRPGDHAEVCLGLGAMRIGGLPLFDFLSMGRLGVVTRGDFFHQSIVGQAFRAWRERLERR